MTTVKALSVREPWASLIASGRKSIELRTWSVKYRGPLIICSGCRPYAGDGEVLAPAREVDAALARPRGVAVALVYLQDVRPATALDAKAACSTPGERDFAWVLSGPVAIPPELPVSGKLSLFTIECSALPPGLVVLIERALQRGFSATPGGQGRFGD